MRTGTLGGLPRRVPTRPASGAVPNPFESRRAKHEASIVILGHSVGTVNPPDSTPWHGLFRDDPRFHDLLLRMNLEP